MGVNSKHPLYTLLLKDWETLIDTHGGERVIKEAGVKYLAATTGMIADGMKLNQPGLIAYQNYRLRARFPDSVNIAVKALVGLMHTKPPSIELPTAMETMREAASDQGESLDVLLRRINQQQLITGRIGLLLDVRTGANVGTLPYIATYDARNIINWDNGLVTDDLAKQNLNLVILDESGQVRSTNFEWEQKDKFRVLVLGETDTNEAKGEGGIYRVGVFTDGNTSFSEDGLIEPSLVGNTLDFIPFTFINATDIVSTPDKPPLLGLADLTLGIYRGEADYRQALFMQGQDTLVVSGATDDEMNFRTGAGASIILPTGGTAEFIGVNSEGIAEMRSALENDKLEAANRSGDMVDTTSRSKESGDALRIRVVARTATLNQIAKTGAFGLQNSLRQVAMWIGVDPELVVVTPNLDFVNDTLGGEELVKLATAKALGAPLSNESIHTLMEEKGLTKHTLEEELALIEAEEPMGGSTAEGGPEDDEDDGGEEE